MFSHQPHRQLLTTQSNVSKATDPSKQAEPQPPTSGHNGELRSSVSPGVHQLTFTGPLQTPITLYTSLGARIAQIQPTGVATAVAVSASVLAVQVGSTIEFYEPRRRTFELAGKPRPGLAASGSTVVFQVAGRIEALRAGWPRPKFIARAAGAAIGLSIVGSRVSWVENTGSSAQIRTVTLR
jgi:hypothetical protein